MGTQKIVDELKEKFPDAKILRMDADTTFGREGHEKILNEFSERKADILVGTQMIAKGLDFSSVTLVGIVSADMSLHLDDFRSYEKTFSLLTQVIGRAGRGKDKGRAVIQTYYPDDEVLNLSKYQDYISFYRNEINVRKSMMYPPYCEMINITSSSIKDSYSYNELRKLRNELISEIKKSGFGSFIRIYNVTKAPMQKINGKFRYRFLIKTNYSKKLYEIIHNVVEKNYKKDISIIVDVNPINMF
jgi:primosomal protein N' (replication factor Y)